MAIELYKRFKIHISLVGKIKEGRWKVLQSTSITKFAAKESTCFSLCSLILFSKLHVLYFLKIYYNFTHIQEEKLKKKKINKILFYIGFSSIDTNN